VQWDDDMTEQRLFWPRGSLADGDFQVAVRDPIDDWEHVTLRVAGLLPGAFVEAECVDEELVVVPLSGSYAVRLSPVARTGPARSSAEVADDPVREIELTGRGSVFEGPTDVAYVPPGWRVTVTHAGESWGQVALCGARLPEGLEGDPLPPSHLPAADVPVELRGAGPSSREVRNFAMPGVLEAHRLLACEVITPSGNWSTWPAHKHDEDRPGEERRLEEVYFFEVQSDASAPGDSDPTAYLRFHDDPEEDDDGLTPLPVPELVAPRTRVDELVEVRSGDVVLVPHGWHGPAMAPPGYDLYYLNVMAGPGEERGWLFRDDPAHAWVRETWVDQPVDPRLPFHA
jgi:5-deoxy-glucuronate isomerase